MLTWIKEKLISPHRDAEQKERVSNSMPETKSVAHEALTQQTVLRQYQAPPSLSAYLPWVDWSDETNTFLLEDGVSVGCLLELKDRATESLPETTIASIHEKLTMALSRLVPLEEVNPWVVQLFIQDDPTLVSLEKKLNDYLPTTLKQQPFSRAYLKIMQAHFKVLCQPEGLFIDPLSGIPYRGKTRRIRMALYRRYTDKKHPPEHNVLDELVSVSESAISTLQSMGMKVRRLRGKGVYDWLVRWFNPAPSVTSGNVDALLKQFPYPHDKQKPFAWSFCQNIFFNAPISKEEGWLFDEHIHRVMAFRELTSLPDIGLISRERAIGDNRYALFDKLPDGAIYTLQITFESKRSLEKHLKKIEDSAVGKGLAPERVKHSVAQARLELTNNHLLFRTAQAIYYRAKTTDEIQTIERQLVALLANAGLNVISPKEEINRLDTYLRFLPFNFNACSGQVKVDIF